MYKWTAFPFVRIAMCLIGGVLLSDFVPEHWLHMPWQYAVAIFLLLGVVYLMLPRIIRGGWCLLLILALGVHLSHWSNQRLAPNHYTNQARVSAFTGVIVSDLTERKDYYRYEVAVQFTRVDTAIQSACGKVYLYVKKKDAPKYQYGDVVMVQKGFFEVAAPKNPHEFDYQRYLSLQNIFAHAFVSQEEVRIIDHAPPNDLLAIAYSIRSTAQELLFQCVRGERERAILVALLLGVKDHLDAELKEAYSSAGAMHVLAVSGLHVGIVYLLLSLAFKRVKATTIGAVSFTLVALATIWMYALVTGFSPSVMRAATMFSVVIISEGVGRKSNIFNSLGIAAVILIFFDPNIIYSVGFQLSFAAVLGIVLLHGPLYRLLDLRSKAWDYIWSITCVSIAAQLATFPLTLLYFHQFPTYFLISNLVVIPAATVMMLGGLVVLVSASVFLPVGAFLGGYFEYFVWTINELVMAISYLPFPLFDWLYMEAWEVWVVYFSMICLVIGLRKYRFKYLVLSVMALMVWSANVIVRDIARQSQAQLIFYELDEGLAIDLIHGKQATLLLDLGAYAQFSKLPPQINPNRLALGLPKIQDGYQLLTESPLLERHAYFDLIEWSGKRIVIVKQNLTAFEQRKVLDADVVYFEDPKVWVEGMQTTGKVVLGGGYNFYRVQAVKKTQPEVHSLTYDGSYVLKLKQSEPTMRRKILSFF